MATKRTPIDRPFRREISDNAIGIFLKMEELRRACRCEPVDPDRYWEHEKCAACVARRQAHVELHNELGVRPWDLVFDLWSPEKESGKVLQAGFRQRQAT